MRHGILIAGLAALAISAPDVVASPVPLYSDFTPYAGALQTQLLTKVAQAQAPTYSPTAPSIVIVPTAPPAPQVEVPPPAPSRSYVWEPGRWSWNGAQYFWQPGRYVERPTVSANFVAGHWEQHPQGWVWVEGHWDYPGVGSSSPPVGYPSAR
jgi:YXWGXW repeat-containing protein